MGAGGGDGSLAAFAAAALGFAPLGSLWKNLRMPPFSRLSWTSPSSSDGAGDSDDRDERSLDSSSAILQTVGDVMVESDVWY